MRVMQSPPGPIVTVDGREYLYFGGTGYLDLHAHPDLVRAAIEATQKYGLGTATTRAGHGTAPPILEVEELAAGFWESESAFYFASGYIGNHVALSVLAKAAGAVFLDENAHYSVEDACRFFDLPVHRFAHRDAGALRKTLKEHQRPGRSPLIMSDGVFASSGAIAPVTDYIEVLQEHEGSMICLDDAHAFGVLGERGRGTYEHYGIGQEGVNDLPGHGGASGSVQLFAVGTLSKAFGGYGGIVCGTEAFIESARNSSHYFAGASAPAIPVAAASAAGLKLVSSTPERVAQVQQNARRLKRGLKGLGLDVNDTPVPILSLILGDARNMRRIQEALADEGILIAYRTQYSGLGECGAIRIAVFATHTEEQIQRLIDTIERHL